MKNNIQKLNEIKIFFGKVVSLDDNEKIFRVQVNIPGYTDKLDKETLPWYFPWYGINYLPQLDDEVAVIIFADNFSIGFYTPKLDIQKRNVTDDDYKTYLEIYKNNEEKVKLTFEKSKGVLFNNDKSTLNLQKDKSVIQTTNKSNLTLKENNVNLVNNKTQIKLEKSGLTLRKENETLKKILVDLIEQIELMKFQNTNGQTVTLLNKAKFTAIKNRTKKFFVN